MTLVPISAVYVDANFKESQFRHIRIGQPVEVISDFYGDDVVYHGRVIGLAGGTGAAFALIPAQNATGNWIKVVQRLPVRVALDTGGSARAPPARRAQHGRDDRYARQLRWPVPHPRKLPSSSR